MSCPRTRGEGVQWSRAMPFVSTRGLEGVSFDDAVFQGWASDGGLFLPQDIPTLSKETLCAWSELSYPEICTEIVDMFINAEATAVPKEVISGLFSDCYSEFVTDDVIPVVPVFDVEHDSGTKCVLEGAPETAAESGRSIAELDGVYFCELFNGPSGAFKDLALLFVGSLFEYLITHPPSHAEGLPRHLTLVVATSGDTGSAAIHSVKRCPHLDIAVLYPSGGRISRVQELQMTTVDAPNVHVLATDGSSDDLDVVLKGVLGDKSFCTRHRVGTINSINWCRIMVQIAHYFFTYFRAVEHHNCHRGSSSDIPATIGEEVVAMCVPTGAFGSGVSGAIARQMGLPIRLVICVNENDVLHEFVQTGTLTPRPAKVTLANAMDIANPYNFERFHYLVSRSSAETAEAMRVLETTGSYTLPPELHAGVREFVDSVAVSEEQICAVIKTVHHSRRYVLDPHSACGAYAAMHLADITAEGVAVPRIRCVQQTAHPAKFPKVIRDTLDIDPPTNRHFNGLEARTEHHTDMPSASVDWEQFLRDLIIRISPDPSSAVKSE